MDEGCSVENRIKGVGTFSISVIDSNTIQINLNKKIVKNRKYIHGTKAMGGRKIRCNEAGEPIIGHHNRGNKLHPAECLESSFGH